MEQLMEYDDELPDNVATQGFSCGSIFHVYQIRGFRWLLLFRERYDDFGGGDGGGTKDKTMML